jgi:hypothetical protein
MELHIKEILFISNTVMLFCIVIAFSFAFYWELKYMKKEKDYSLLKIYRALALFLTSLVYGILFGGVIWDSEAIATSGFGNLYIRPVIFFLGCSLAATARARCMFLERGK